MPDPLDLDAIEARANAATPGPWEWTRPEFSPSSDCHVLLSTATTTDHGHTARIEVHSDGSAYGEYNPDIDVNGPDAAFIAHARTDIPALVARVRQLEAEQVCDLADVDRFRAMARAYMDERDERTRQHAARGAEAVAVIDGLRVEVAELRARETALIAAADADERAHRERAGLNTDGTMVRTADEALSWLVAALFVERAASRIANEDMAELRATLARLHG